MVSQIYPLELQLNKANTSDTKALFLNLHLSYLVSEFKLGHLTTCNWHVCPVKNYIRMDISLIAQELCFKSMQV